MTTIAEKTIQNEATMQDRIDLADRLNVCAAKLSFISDLFSQPYNQAFRFSQDGETGFYFIVSEIEDEIRKISNEC